MMPPKLGILAGGGRLPHDIIRACQSEDREFLVVAFEDQADASAFDDVPHVWVRLGAAATTLKHLREAGVEELVMAGSVERPSLAALRPDKWAVKFFTKSGVQALGDDSLLSTLVRTLESEEGFRIVGADSLVPDLVAREGVYGSVAPDSQGWNDIREGIRAARALGARDVGQAVIVRSGRVVGEEDANGTDSLLDRVAAIDNSPAGGVLVKVKKPGQERRVDLPAIGPATVERANRAGLAGIAVEAASALVLDREDMIVAADAAEMFVVGFDADRLWEVSD